MQDLLAVFPYATEQEKVTDILKTRISQLASRRFTRGNDVAQLLTSVSPQGGVGVGGASRRRSVQQGSPITISPGASPANFGKRMSMMSLSKLSASKPSLSTIPTLNESPVSSEEKDNLNDSNFDAERTPVASTRKRSLSHASLSTMVVTAEDDSGASSTQDRGLSPRTGSRSGSIQHEKRASNGNASNMAGQALGDTVSISGKFSSSLESRATNNTPFGSGGSANGSVTMSLFGVVDTSDSATLAEATDSSSTEPELHAFDEPSRAIDGLDLYTTEGNLRATARRASFNFTELVDLTDANTSASAKESSKETNDSGNGEGRASLVRQRRKSEAVIRLLQEETLDNILGASEGSGKVATHRKGAALTTTTTLSATGVSIASDAEAKQTKAVSSPPPSKREAAVPSSAPQLPTQSLDYSPVPPLAGAGATRRLSISLRKLPPTETLNRKDLLSRPSTTEDKVSIRKLLTSDFTDDEHSEDDIDEMDEYITPSLSIIRESDLTNLRVSEEQASSFGNRMNPATPMSSEAAPGEETREAFNYDAIRINPSLQAITSQPNDKERRTSLTSTSTDAPSTVSVTDLSPARKKSIITSTLPTAEASEGDDIGKDSRDRRPSLVAIFSQPGLASNITPNAISSTVSPARKKCIVMNSDAQAPAEPAESKGTFASVEKRPSLKPVAATEIVATGTPVLEKRPSLKPVAATEIVATGTPELEKRPSLKAVAAVVSTTATAAFQSTPVRATSTVPASAPTPEGKIESKLASMKRLISSQGKNYFLSVPAEDSIGADATTGLKLYSYKELVRLNIVKTLTNVSAEGVSAQKLEDHLFDKEFLEIFGCDRQAFSALPAWKKTSIKKEVFLF